MLAAPFGPERPDADERRVPAQRPAEGSMARPQLLHVFKDYWPTPGGVERTMRALVRGCADAYDCTVLVNAAGPRTSVEYLDGATVIRAGTLGQVAMTP